MTTTEPRSFVALLGVAIDRTAPNGATVSLTIEQRHRNGNGVVHGSVIHALLDTCMGIEAIKIRGNEPVATCEISVRFLAPVFEGLMVAHAKVLRTGKRLTVMEGEVRLGDEIVAVAHGTFVPIHRRSA